MARNKKKIAGNGEHTEIIPVFTSVDTSEQLAGCLGLFAIAHQLETYSVFRDRDLSEWMKTKRKERKVFTPDPNPAPLCDLQPLSEELDFKGLTDHAGRARKLPLIIDLG